MTKLIMRTLCIALASGAIALASADIASAKGNPPGFTHGKKVGWHGRHVPPGWSHGRKVGWRHGSRPPGLR